MKPLQPRSTRTDTLVPYTTLFRSAVQTQRAVPPAPATGSRVSTGLARWNSLRQSDRLPFTSYASFLTSYRGWPGETAMRKTAEQAIDPNNMRAAERSEEHTSELQSLMRISYAVFCLKKKKHHKHMTTQAHTTLTDRTNIMYKYTHI